VLLTNSRWFVNIRWFLVVLFVLLGLACSAMPQAMERLAIASPARWPWVLAGVLILANACFHVLVNRLKADAPRRVIETSLWLQIVADLAIITALVRLVGSTSTLIAFAYLSHIALSCVLFPPRKSLLVLVLATALYFACVSVEIAFELPPSGILVVPDCACEENVHARMRFAGSAAVIWIVIWYLISRFSEALRARDQRLEAANRRILQADQERNRQVLRTTHDLKVPFSGIETSTQRLRVEHWEELSEPVRAIIERIERRSEALRKRVADILLLGDLRSKEAHHDEPPGPVDLQAVMDDVVELLGQKLADKDRQISLRADVPPLQVFGDREQFAVLLANLVSNAITYSREGGSVTVIATQTEEGVQVSVADTGMGIRNDALPSIFDDYFRTKEAADFNKMSTGLGLSIVKEIARRFQLKIRVTSEEGAGTTFDVLFPTGPSSTKERRTTDHG